MTQSPLEAIPTRWWVGCPGDLRPDQTERALTVAVQRQAPGGTRVGAIAFIFLRICWNTPPGCCGTGMSWANNGLSMTI